MIHVNVNYGELCVYAVIVLKGEDVNPLFFTHHVSCALVFAPSGNTRKYKLELDS